MQHGSTTKYFGANVVPAAKILTLDLLILLMGGNLHWHSANTDACLDLGER
jgi:hypothetical protein